MVNTQDAARERARSAGGGDRLKSVEFHRPQASMYLSV